VLSWRFVASPLVGPHLITETTIAGRSDTARPQP